MNLESAATFLPNLCINIRNSNIDTGNANQAMDIAWLSCHNISSTNMDPMFGYQFSDNTQNVNTLEKEERTRLIMKETVPADMSEEPPAHPMKLDDNSEQLLG